ncbi:beta-propeller fold lactonase family protein [Microbulbifer sp.]|uniref:YVTN family beta-propeller repeat protein n=1 Tax=Microbulbifer sp. TaxID=1908541 RepID=UPI003F3824D3
MSKSKGSQSLTGTIFATLPDRNSVVILDLKTMKITSTISVGYTPYGAVSAFDGKKVYVSNSGSDSVSVIDIASATVTHEISVGRRPWDLAIHPDGSKVYVANIVDGTISVIDVDSHAVVDTFPVKNYGGANDIAFAPNGTRLYVTSLFSGYVTAFDTKDNTIVGTTRFGNYVLGIAVSPLTHELFVTNYGTNGKSSDTVSVIDPDTFSVTRDIKVGTQPGCAFFSSDGKTVYVTNENSATVSVIDAASYSVTKTIAVGEGPRYIWIRNDDSVACVTNEYSKTLSIIDLSSNTVVETRPIDGGPVGVTMLPSKKEAGITISQVTSPTTQRLFAVTYGKGKFVATGSDGQTIYSTDGLHWKLNPPLPYTQFLYLDNVAYNGAEFMITGKTASSRKPNFFSGSNGTNWDGHIVDGIYSAIAWGNNVFVAVGSYGGVHGKGVYIATTTKNNGWKVFKDASGTSLQSVTYGNGKFVAIGSHVRISTDGLNWASYDTGFYPSLVDICWSQKNGMFVAVGQLGLIITSPDGISWTVQSSGTQKTLMGICWDESIMEFAAVGDGGIVLTSPDGATWTSQLSPVSVDLYGIVSADEQFVVVGENGVILQMVITK